MFSKRGGVRSGLLGSARIGTLAGGVSGFCMGIAVAAAGAAVLGGNILPEVFAARAEGTAESHGAPVPSNVDEHQAAILIKSTIMAIHQANQTGNYSVLRDLGTPGFRERFDQARLTAVFAKLRSLRVDFSPVLSMAPSLYKVPELTAANEVHLTGDFSTQPLQVHYDLAFAWIGGEWRIEGLAIDTIAVKAISGAQSAPPPTTKNIVPRTNGSSYPS
jgi:hypothetical protein